MDHQELLLAAAVRKRVGEIWNAQRTNFERGLNEIGDSKVKRMADWDAKNPMINFIKPAYEELALIAEHIREIRKEA